MWLLRFLRRLHGGSKGQAAVEAMLAITLLFFFLFIVVDFSLLLRDWIMVRHSVREGARYGALGSDIDASDIISRVVATSSGLMQSGEVSVGYVDRPGNLSGNGDRGDSVVVRANHTYTFRFIQNIFTVAPSLTMTTCADGRLEVAVLSAPGGTSC